MEIRIRLRAEIEAPLLAEADAGYLSAGKCAEEILKGALVRRAYPTGRMSIEELHKMLAGMAKGSEGLPVLPTESFSRASFYSGPMTGSEE